MLLMDQPLLMQLAAPKTLAPLAAVRLTLALLQDLKSRPRRHLVAMHALPPALPVRRRVASAI